MAKGEYITRHSSIKELYLKREKAVDIAVEIRKLVPLELMAVTWRLHGCYTAVTWPLQVSQELAAVT